MLVMDDDFLALTNAHGFLLARDARAVGAYDRLRYLVDAGAYVRVQRGAFVERRSWDHLTADARYLLRIRAFVMLSEAPVVLSHWSAAAVLGLPVAGAWPKEVHCLRPSGAGGRDRPGVRTHAGLERVRTIRVDGLDITDPAETVLSLAASAPFPTAVAFADAALRTSGGRRLITDAQLHNAVAEMNGRAGVQAAAEVAAFADGRSESVGESVSRANMLLAGVEIPDIQVTLRDAAGLIGRADFAWRRCHIVGEFDGVAKYVRHEYTHGEDAGTIVIREKKREDRLRAAGERVIRWGWKEANSPATLRTLLMAAGVPERRDPAFPRL